MNKYQVTVSFANKIDQEFMSKIPQHRAYINRLILSEVIDTYAISAERSMGWILMNARSEAEIHTHLEKSPLYQYFNIGIDQLMVYDSRMYRFPKMVLN
jgi:hypothetical protein